MDSLPTNIILFDGVCNLCNASVKFILKYEKKETFIFGSLQSDRVKEVLTQFRSERITDSILYIENDQLFQESTAALKIAKHLRYFGVLYYLIYLPEWLRNPFYRFIARNRYNWFGKRETCMIPEERLKNRFL